MSYNAFWKFPVCHTTMVQKRMVVKCQVCELSDSDAIGDPLDWTIKQGWNKGVTHWLILGHNNQTLLGS